MLLNQDCLEFVKTMRSESIDLIIADPPYFEIVDEQWDNQWDTEEEYYEWIGSLLIEFKRILKSSGSLYMWGSYNSICDIGYLGRKTGFTIRNLITWCRGGGKERTNWTGRKEELLYLTLSDRPTFNLDDVLIGLDDDSRLMKKSSWERLKYERKDRKNFDDNKVNPSNVWFDSLLTPNCREKTSHPTQKPLSVCNRIVLSSSNKGDTVYIPFAGSGSEIEACIRNERNWIATEKHKPYIDEIIIPRIS